MFSIGQKVRMIKPTSGNISVIGKTGRIIGARTEDTIYHKYMIMFDSTVRGTNTQEDIEYFKRRDRDRKGQKWIYDETVKRLPPYRWYFISEDEAEIAKKGNMNGV